MQAPDTADRPQAPDALRRVPEHRRSRRGRDREPTAPKATPPPAAVLLSCLLVLPATAVPTATDLSSWTHRHRGSLPTDLRAIAVSPSGSRVVAVGTDGGAAWSHDGGASWTSAHLGTDADATGVAWQDDSRVWVSGVLPSGWTSSGVLLRSDDGGRTWTAVVSDHPVPLTSVAFADADHGVADQPADGLLETTDGGVTWMPVAHPGLGLASVEFFDPLLGHAAGTGFDFTLSRTTDGGASWTHQSSGAAADLHDVRALGPAEVLVVGEGGIVLTTADGGASWQTADADTTADLRAIALADATTPLVAGDWGTVIEPGNPALVFADGFETGGLSLSGPPPPRSAAPPGTPAPSWHARPPPQGPRENGPSVHPTCTASSARPQSRNPRRSSVHVCGFASR